MELPEDRVPEDSRVEIDAKITAGVSPFAPSIPAGSLTRLPRIFHDWKENDRGRAPGSPGEDVGGVG